MKISLKRENFLLRIINTLKNIYMKKLFISGLIMHFLILSLNAQIYTPAGQIQGASGSNKVGIGTSAPQQLLHIYRSSGNDYDLRVGNTTGYNMKLGYFVNSAYATIQSYYTSESTYGTLALNPLGGNVGIGITNTEDATLKVYKSSYPVFNLANAQNRLEIGIAQNNGEYASWAMAGDITYRELGAKHGIIFAMADVMNDGNSYIRFGDELHGALLSIYNNAKILINCNVGIKTTTPISPLHVSTTVCANSMSLGSTSGIAFAVTKGDEGFGLYTGIASLGYSWLQAGRTNTATAYNLILQSAGGNVGIGTTDPGSYKLNVWGKIRAHEVVVNTTGADFVFNSNYRLPTLSEVESFIKENNHLPDIAPAAEMKENGMCVSEMQTKLLQKLEEMTLYIIEQNKTNELQSSEIESLKQEIKTLTAKSVKH